ncbi:hypothetical protein [Pseudonocardia dioxanivorans]|uniref:hypothetical protein n=1 Tax=Pseudonocardia dioxanivorans TaxID=240495 RepID=UPI000CD04BAA|nr:hypothetical protein [Pseudonocardia dioxanivorans]
MNEQRDELLRAAYQDGDRDALRRVYLAGCFAKMQRSGSCSRDFDPACGEAITDQHIRWADEVLAGLDRTQLSRV